MVMDVIEIMAQGVVWDNHSCMPLRPGDPSFLSQLERYRNSGVDMVMLNISFGDFPLVSTFEMLAEFRYWICQHAADYQLVHQVDDIIQAKHHNKLAIAFDIEGGCVVETHPGLVEIFYDLGVRWMLIAYNKNNRLGGGCQDKDTGLTDYGRTIIDEMQRVGMVLCCSHTGSRTAMEAMAYSSNPVIFSHSNPRSVYNHERNIPDQLIKACAATGGVISINGIGLFLGDNDNSTGTLLRHIDYVVNLVGIEHVGLGLDYVFDTQELDALFKQSPDLFPVEKGYSPGIKLVEPERIPLIAEGLLAMNYTQDQVKAVLGGNNLRVAKAVWR